MNSRKRAFFFLYTLDLKKLDYESASSLWLPIIWIETKDSSLYWDGLFGRGRRLHSLWTPDSLDTRWNLMSDSCVYECERSCSKGQILDFWLQRSVNNAQMPELPWQHERAEFCIIKINGCMLSAIASVQQQLMTQWLLNSHKQKMEFGAAMGCKSGQNPVFRWEWQPSGQAAKRVLVESVHEERAGPPSFVV